MLDNQVTHESSVVLVVAEKVCPGGFFPDVWRRFTAGDIDFELQVAEEIAEELWLSKKLDLSADVKLIVHVALHDGFQCGVDYIRSLLGVEGTPPPVMAEGREPPLMAS